MRARWVSVSPKAAAGSAALPLPLAGERPQAAAAMPSTASVAMVRRSAIMGSSGRGGVERTADGALEVRPGIVGGAQRVGVLLLGVEQRAAGVEDIERR